MAETIKLSPLDLLLPRTWTRWMLHFTPQENQILTATSLLSRSFDALLLELPILGGYLTDTQNRPNHVDQMTIPLHPPSPFTISHFPEWAVTDRLETDQYPLSECPTNSTMIQIFAAQANIIEPNIITLAFCVHHNVMDGAAMALVIRRWSQHCHSIANSTPLPPSPSLIYARKHLSIIPKDGIPKDGIFSNGIPNDGILNDGILKDFSTALICPSAYKITANPDIRPPAAQFKTPPEMLVEILTINIPALTILQSSINAHLRNAHTDRKTPHISANTVLTALLWTCITRARNPSPSTLSTSNTNSRLNTAVNIRSCVLPPSVAPIYIGTAAIAATTLLPLSHLLSPPTTPILSETCTAIHTSIISALDPASITTLISYISSIPDTNAIIPAPDFCCGNDLIINSQTGFGIYKDEWGSTLGGGVKKVRKQRYPGGRGYDGLVTMMPRGRGGELEVVVSLMVANMGRLLADEVFKGVARVGEW